MKKEVISVSFVVAEILTFEFFSLWDALIVLLFVALITAAGVILVAAVMKKQ
jgi:hypothetical protein